MNEITTIILGIVNKCINSKEDKENDIVNNVKIIEDVIEINNTQLDDDLIELGVDSITFIRIIVELEELFKIEIPDEKLLITEMGTIRKIVEVVAMLSDLTKV